MKKETLQIACIIMATIIISVGSWIAFWAIERKVNWELSYESMVERTITEIVKSECLNDNKGDK